MIRLIFILSMYSLHALSQKMDTINVYFLGEFKQSESYLFKYNKDIVHNSNAKGFFVDSFKIVINTNEIKPYQILKFNVLKTTKKTFEDTKLFVLYEPNKKILLIERGYRLKDKYAVSYRWLDKKRTVGILPELWTKFGVIPEDDLSPR